VDTAVLPLDCGDEDGLFEGCEAGEVAFVTIDLAFDAVIVEVTLLEVVET
jgi:hypothetical protein